MMFYGRMSEYEYYRPVVEKDDFNYPEISYSSSPTGTVQMYITIQDRTEIEADELKLYKGTYVGFTNSGEIQEKDRIGDDYII